MSSGAYVYIPTYRDNIERLSVEESNLSKLFNETMKEINTLKDTLSSTENISEFSFSAERSISVKGLVDGISRDVESGLVAEELIFAEIDTSYGDIVYISHDYSGILSISNAINSSEYKKMKLASEINKHIMLLPVDSDNVKEAIASFLVLLNKTLDDESVDFDFFNDYIVKRFELIKRMCLSDESMFKSDEWKEYCALCILVGQTPKLLTGKELQEQIYSLKQTLLESKYLEEAKKALRETLDELGLTIAGECSFEGIEGNLVDCKDIEGYRFFVSEQKDNFIVEMLEDDNPAPSSKVEMCNKRREIATIMERKGFPLGILSESDGCVSSKTIRRNNFSRSCIVERSRERRMIAGKKPHAKMIGR